MSEELKDNEVIGMSGYIDADITVQARDLDEKNRRYWEIGKAASEARIKLDDMICVVHSKVLYDRQQGKTYASIKGWMTDAYTKGYAVGLAAAKPTGWRVEIRNWGGSVWSAFLIFPDGFEQEMEYTTTNGTPDDVKAHSRVQFIIKDLHAEVVVVPKEKKGDAE